MIERRYVETTSSMSKEWYHSSWLESVCPKCHGQRLQSKHSMCTCWNDKISVSLHNIVGKALGGLII